MKQSEKHDGPHTPWFFDTTRSGGGVTFDMGCHAIEFFRWILGGPSSSGKARIETAYAQLGRHVHSDKTSGDDEALLILTFEGGATGLAEESWNKPGGMDDRAEVYGSDGQAYADLLYGNSLRTFSRKGYGYAVEKAGTTAGWSFPIYQEIWNYGFPQEMEHFIACVRDGTQPSENGADGRAVVEAVLRSTNQPPAEPASICHSPATPPAPSISGGDLSTGWHGPRPCNIAGPGVARATPV